MLQSNGRCGHSIAYGKTSAAARSKIKRARRVTARPYCIRVLYTGLLFDGETIRKRPRMAYFQLFRAHQLDSHKLTGHPH